jgi:hypothetical protein
MSILICRDLFIKFSRDVILLGSIIDFKFKDFKWLKKSRSQMQAALITSAIPFAIYLGSKDYKNKGLTMIDKASLNVPI